MPRSLDAGGVPLTPSARTVTEAAWPAADPRMPAAVLPARGADAPQWLILVARDESDLYSHLVRALSRDNKVQILMDRRKDYSRNPPGMEERLRTHGAAVLRRRPT